MFKFNLSKSKIILILGILLIFLIGISAIFNLRQKPQFQPLLETTNSPKIKKELKINLVGTYPLVTHPALVKKIVIQDNKYLYIGGGHDLEIIDVNNPTQPITLRFPEQNTGVIIEEIDIRGNYLYVIERDISDTVYFKVWDVSNPLKFKNLGFYDSGSKFYPNSITGIDNYVFFGTANGLLIFDISNPENTVQVGSHETGIYNNEAYEVGSIEKMVISGNYLYAIGGYGKIKKEKNKIGDSNFVTSFLIFDISNRTTPVLVGKNDTVTLPESIFLSDKIVYILTRATPKAGLYIFDASNPNNIVLLGAYQKEGLRDLYLSNYYAYITSRDSLLILDISNPAKPTLIEEVPGDFRAIAGSGNFIYTITPKPDEPSVSLLKIFEIK